MRVDREVLLNIARQNAERLSVEEPWVLAIYLTGSVASGEPLIGGTADIDLIVVHDEEMEGREIHRVTEDIHLDILNQPRSFYEEGRKLRLDPVWGHTLYHCVSLYDPKHFISILQANVRGMYQNPEFAVQRLEGQLGRARNTWLDFHNNPPDSSAETSWKYLSAVRDCANTLACINSGPLTNRGFMSSFKAAAEEIGVPGLYNGLVGLLGGTEFEDQLPQDWLEYWKDAVLTLDAQEGLEEIDPIRQNYYFKAVEVMVESGNPSFAFWPVLYTWNLAARFMEDEAKLQVWEERFKALGLTGDKLIERLAGFDLYLEQVESLVDNWKEYHGI